MISCVRQWHRRMGENAMTRWGRVLGGSGQPHGLSALSPLVACRKWKKKTSRTSRSGETPNRAFWHANPARIPTTTTCSNPYLPLQADEISDQRPRRFCLRKFCVAQWPWPLSVSLFFILGPTSPRDAMRRRAPNQSAQPSLVEAWAVLFPYPTVEEESGSKEGKGCHTLHTASLDVHAMCPACSMD